MGRLLSDKDAQWLKRLEDLERQRPREVRHIPYGVHEPQPGNPLYLCHTPTAGIPGLIPDVGSVARDDPGFNTCDVYHWHDGIQKFDLIETQIVYNLSEDPVPGDVWIPVHKDAHGNWWTRWYEEFGSGTMFDPANVNITGGTINNVVIGGTTPAQATFTSLVINGQTTIGDTLIQLGYGNVTNTKDMGFYVQYQPSATVLYSGLFYDITDNTWKFFDSLQTAPSSDVINIGGAGYTASTLQVGSLVSTTVSGGSGSGGHLTLKGSTHATNPGSTYIQVDSADTNTIRETGAFVHTTSGTSSTGFGVSHNSYLENASGTLIKAGGGSFLFTDATATSEDVDYTISLMTGGSVSEAGRFISGGGLTLPERSTPSTPASGYGTLYFKTDGILYVKNDGGVETALIGVPATPPATVGLSAVPTWFLAKTVTHADLTDADTSQDVTAYSAPAKACLHGHSIRTKTAGSGGGVGTLSVQLLVDGTAATSAAADGLVAGSIAHHVDQGSYTPNNTLPLSWSTSKTIAARFTADVNVADLTAGEWEVYLLLSTLG